MRDIKRIDTILAILSVYWHNHPDLRLGQIIGNMNINYYTEDDEVMRKIGISNESENRAKALRNKFDYDYVLQVHEGNDFTEFVVKTGGDTLTWRVYGSNGDYKIYER